MRTDVCACVCVCLCVHMCAHASQGLSHFDQPIIYQCTYEASRAHLGCNTHLTKWWLNCGQSWHMHEFDADPYIGSRGSLNCAMEYPLYIYVTPCPPHLHSSHPAHPQSQYIYIHAAINDYINCKDTTIVAHELRPRIEEIRQIDSTTGSSGFSTQFSVSPLWPMSLC